MKSLLLKIGLMLLDSCSTVTPSVVELPPPPKPMAPEAAMAPIHPAGWFEKTLIEILKR